MESAKVLKEPIFPYEFTVPDEAVDENGHVNNVMYLQWMQDAAVRHYEAMGGRQITLDIGATWVVRSHMIEYLPGCNFLSTSIFIFCPEILYISILISA